MNRANAAYSIFIHHFYSLRTKIWVSSLKWKMKCQQIIRKLNSNNFNYLWITFSYCFYLKWILWHFILIPSSLSSLTIVIIEKYFAPNIEQNKINRQLRFIVQMNCKLFCKPISRTQFCFSWFICRFISVILY